MVTALLLLTLGCQGTPAAGPDAEPLAVGVHAVSLGGADRVVTLAPGEVLAIGALSDRAEVELTVSAPSGVARSARSSAAEHRAATLRLTSEAGGVYRIGVRGLLASDRGEATLIRRKPLEGSICAQLDHLSAGDGWAMPGVEHPGADEARRTRSLVAVAPWAEECTVNRLGAMDVGPSCSLSGLAEAEAQPLYARLQDEFRSCHDGWLLSEEGDATTREWVAELGAALHFVRIRETSPDRWQVSTGAMPTL